MKIPFAFCEKTGDIKSIDDVPNGQNCGCICPSCELPLIAKQGQIQEWHFSHNTKFDKTQKYKDCDFSYHASVRLMIKEMLVREMRIMLPEYLVNLGIKGQEAKVTPSRLLKYDDIVTDFDAPEIANKVDACVTVSNQRLYIFISYQNRPLNLLNDITSAKGLVELSIENLHLLHRGESCENLLKDWLLKQTKLKHWIYHARYENAVTYGKQRINRYMADLPEKELFRYCLNLAREEFRSERELDPDMPGWIGIVESIAIEKMKQIRLSKAFPDD